MKFVVGNNHPFFTAILFVVENKIILVQHWQDGLIKIPGGTYHPKRQENLSPREVNEHYYHHIYESVYDKFQKVLSRMLIDHQEIIPKKDIYSIAKFLSKKYFGNASAIHAIIEMIEETGIIPIEIEEFEYVTSGIQKFFFVCQKAIAFSTTQGKFIDVDDVYDVPVRNRDFQNQDPDIKKNLVLNFEEVLKKIKENRVNRHHVGVIVRYFESQVD